MPVQVDLKKIAFKKLSVLIVILMQFSVISAFAEDFSILPVKGLATMIGLGHCLPIVIAGSSAAAVRRLMENTAWQTKNPTCYRRDSFFVLVCVGIFTNTKSEIKFKI